MCILIWIFMGLIPYNYSTQPVLHLLLGHLYNLSPIHTYVMHKSEKALGRSARKSCVVCWERRLFLLKDGNVTAKWLRMTDTVETEEGQRGSLKQTFESIFLHLQFASSPQRNLPEWLKPLLQSMSTAAFLPFAEQPPRVLQNREHLQPRPCPTEALTAHSPAGILSAGACMMLTRVGISLICIGPWQASIWASSLKISWAREATTGSGKRKHHLLKHTHIPIFWLGKATSFPSTFTTGINVRSMTID